VPYRYMKTPKDRASNKRDQLYRSGLPVAVNIKYRLSNANANVTNNIP